MKYSVFLVLICTTTLSSLSTSTKGREQSGNKSRDKNPKRTAIYGSFNSRNYSGGGSWTGRADGGSTANGDEDVINIHYHFHETVWEDDTRAGQCKYPGQACFSRGQCCDKHINTCHITKKYDPVSGNLDLGTCGTCSYSGRVCRTNADCCLETDRCSGKPGYQRACLPCKGLELVKPFCAGHVDCCPGKKCTDGICQSCKSRSQSCSHASECCAEAPMCRNGKCNTCVSNKPGDLERDHFGCEKSSDCCARAAKCRKSKFGGHTYCQEKEDCKPRENNCLSNDECHCHKYSILTTTVMCSCKNIEPW